MTNNNLDLIIANYVHTLPARPPAEGEPWAPSTAAFGYDGLATFSGLPQGRFSRPLCNAEIDGYIRTVPLPANHPSRERRGRKPKIYALTSSGAEFYAEVRAGVR